MASGSDKRHPAASRLLLLGVAVSFTLLIAGLAMVVAGGSVPGKLDWREITRPVVTAGPSLLLHLGILALVATPVVTVFALAVEFAKSRETLFAMLCLGILLLLCVGLYTGVR